MNYLFDLDGTIIDSRPGVMRCLQTALLSMGRPSLSMAQLEQFIGPPLRVALRDLLETGDADLIEDAVRRFRTQYELDGITDFTVFPGVADALMVAKDRGHHLLVVTAKPEPYARTILRHPSIPDCFADVIGAELSGERSDKGSLVARALQCASLDPCETWMIGDRSHDIAGAKHNGVKAVGALWGFGDEAELRNAGADYLARHPGELEHILSM